MTKTRMGLIGLTTSLVVLNFAYYSEARKNILHGTHFTSGATIMKNGDIYAMDMRFQSHDSYIHDFEQINMNSQKFLFSRVNSFFGSARFVTHPVSGNELLRTIATRDRDIAFNYAYYSSALSNLTFYRLTIGSHTPCFYLKELEKVMCMGRERVRDVTIP